MTVNTLRIVLGDQLDRDSTLLAECGADDLVWMAELPAESTHVWSHKARSAFFISAMRHFAADLKAVGVPLQYHVLGEHDWPDFSTALAAAIGTLQPQRLAVIQPGDGRVLAQLRDTCQHHQCPLDILPDHHFYCDLEAFEQWANGRKSLRMEYFYRFMRRRFGVLMDGDQPEGARWNFDSDNRASFPASGPGMLTQPPRFPPDPITAAAIAAIQQFFPDHPGSTDHFDWPVTPEQAEQTLQDFIDHRLLAFGDYQDAMWTGEPWLYHARLAAALNVKLLDPRTVVARVESAYRNGSVPLNAAEGFIRQILGWREYVRGLYWRHYEHYQHSNALGAEQPLPDFYWHGNTGMRCLAEVIGQTLDYGYAHHIQRLMVTGLFALLLGVKPDAIHRWYLAVYVDAVEWVEMPNTVGMSQYADGGLMASKPYIATGKYIDRMSNYCQDCRYRPNQRTGETACPFTTLYWDFLIRHRERFAGHPRLSLQCRNLDRIDAAEQRAIAERAAVIRDAPMAL